MNNRRIFWGLGLLLSFLLFYFWMPNSIYNQSPVIVAAIGAALFFFFSVQLICDFRLGQLSTRDKPLSKWRFKVPGFMALAAIAMCMIYMMHFSSSETDELKKHGILVKGTVVDRSSHSNRKGSGTIYDATVKFYTREGQSLTVKEDIGKYDFDLLHKGQKIDLIYSNKNPTLLKLLLDDSDIETFTGLKSRDIDMKDLKKLLTMSPDSAGAYLNTISFSWTQQGSSWSNERKNQLIEFNSSNQVTYTAVGVGQYFAELLRNDFFTSYKADTTNKNIAFLQNDSYIAALGVRFQGIHPVYSLSIMAKPAKK